ncbi:MAG: hypothetical protein J2P57_08820 [Acidimicrobiaceae bacterium]|nr:hypothetical protein [Acidimicrobiaceae bacterium]
MIRRAEFKAAMDNIDRRFERIDARLAEITTRIDTLIDTIAHHIAEGHDQ